jgi:thiamine pyrophosphokinase
MQSTNNVAFDCVVCLNGTLPSNATFQRLNELPIIAADGAASKLIECGIMPAAIVGDMDSIADISSDITFIHKPEQNTYDFEKCLQYAKEQGYKHALIVGINGGEYEHSLNNWSIFVKWSRQLQITCYTDGRCGIWVSQNISIDTNIGEVISIIPSPIATLSSKGLRWELQNTTLSLGNVEGARNEAITEQVDIHLHSGSFCLFRSLQL